MLHLFQNRMKRLIRSSSEEAFAFYKMHGLGNDFVITTHNKSDFDKMRILKISDRRYGIGCDQFIVIEKVNNNTGRIYFYNSDGSYATMCGNGARCVAWLMHNHLKYDKKITLFIDNKILVADCFEDYEVSIEITEYSFAIPALIRDNSENFTQLQRKFGLPNLCYVNVGNQHIIYFVSNLALYDIGMIGEEIQRIIASGVNVTLAMLQSRKEICIKTYERGAGVTNACGSAAMSVGSYYIKHMAFEEISEVLIKMPGGNLVIRLDNISSAIIMRGKVSYIFSGECYL